MGCGARVPSTSCSILVGSWAGGTHATIELERLGQPLARFGRVRLAVNHDVLHLLTAYLKQHPVE
jgi:hypothetical protein